ASPGASGTMVFSSFDSSTGNFLATWQNSSDNTPYFSIYDGSGWISLAQITSSIATSSDVFCSSDSNGHFLVTWIDSNSNKPYYAIYTENSTTWSMPTFIPSSLANAAVDVVSSYDSSTGNFLVTWVNNNEAGYYSVYNPTHSPTWTPAALIPNAQVENTPATNVFSSSDSRGNFLTTWLSGYNVEVTYSTYDSINQSWSSPGYITNSQSSIDVTSSFDSSTGNFLVTWQDNNSNRPYYSIYNPSASPQYTAQSPVAPTTPVDANTNGVDIFSSCDPGSGTFLVTFVDTNNIPSYTFYTDTSPVQAPGNFTGKQKVNNFGVVSERYNALSWEASIGATFYRLYRNGTLIATLGSNATSYDDHNQPKQAQSYTLTAVDAGGAVASATISVGK
ncbi:MAG: hypothetical protein NTX49_09000, partial [Chlamydiae bacterium]|nr:hypothetical protein [Chlamydiota bacterium]